MNWYVIYMNFDCSHEFILLFNQYSDIYVFKPKVEYWFKNSHIQEYQSRDLYPNYLFIKTSLNESEFMSKYEDLLKSVERLGRLLNKDDVIILRKEEQIILSQLFDQGDIIRHSIGHKGENGAVIDEGPMVGLEKFIKKVNRHKRFALLDFHFNGLMMRLPLEIVA